jgi:hypothetical protein
MQHKKSAALLKMEFPFLYKDDPYSGGFPSRVVKNGMVSTGVGNPNPEDPHVFWASRILIH